MNKVQQLLAVLLIVNSILFIEFKTMILGALILVFIVALVAMVWSESE